MTRDAMLRVLHAALPALLIAGHGPAAAQDDHDDHAGHDHEQAEERIVHLAEDVLAEFGIETAAAGPGVLRDWRQLPAEVRASADRVAHLVPRYEGVVTEVRAGIGDRVRAGQVLARIENSATLVTFPVTTMLAGVVIDRALSLGEAVGRDRPVFVIADLDTVWVDIAVYLRDLEQVAVGQAVTLLCGRHDEPVHDHIDYVSPVVDEATRTATARVVMANHDLHWRPGMFATARVLVNETPVPVAVPPSAVLLVDGRSSVFVQTGDGFVPRPVTLGRATDELVEIAGGLAPGETFVVRNGFTLKAELEKASFGDGHAH
jgi:cobalt-zinc-cadmium efflux system membrane fusion protein